MAPDNVAAWALESKERPLFVGHAPYNPPPRDHVVVKVSDVAVNPIDWIEQESDIFRKVYPTIFGYDAAGEIAAVGENVKDLKTGQRVIANCSVGGRVACLPVDAQGAFQRYVLVSKYAVAELPDAITSSAGAVLPLSISTAAAGLYQRGYLQLPLPSPKPRAKPACPLPSAASRLFPLPRFVDEEDKPRSLLVWGGSSSVGSSVLQLAAASGVTTVATASPHNFAYCEALGAAAVFDYRDSDAEDRIVEALAGTTVLGAYHATGGDDAARACARVVERCRGKAVVVSTRGVPDDGSIPSSVRTRMISAADIFTNSVGPSIWRDFLPTALKTGVVAPWPQANIVGEGLRSVQAGLDAQKKGVSATKIVISYIS